jgi:catechol 2,3-dioxygenase-like lactoylglutathione lyase family enzyme
MSANPTRANKIATVIIPTADQGAAVDFYINKLGFELRSDIPFGGDMRWIEVGLGSEATTIALAPPPPEVTTGNRETGISLQADDIDAFHTQLQQAGVDVDVAVSRMGDPVPPMFWLRDPEGNILMVVQ